MSAVLPLFSQQLQGTIHIDFSHVYTSCMEVINLWMFYCSECDRQKNKTENIGKNNVITRVNMSMVMNEGFKIIQK